MAVHVRRGDLVPKAGYHGYMDATYYEAALRLAEAAGAFANGTRLFVFSDDFAWTREQVAFTSRGATFIEGENEIASFYLLAACARKAVVCPNSTFCWWAAYLARATALAAGKLPGFVAMPRKWIIAMSAPDIYWEGVTVVEEGGVSARRLR